MKAKRGAMGPARFDIAIEANSLGVDTSAEQLAAFADRIERADRAAMTDGDAKIDEVVTTTRDGCDRDPAPAAAPVR